MFLCNFTRYDLIDAVVHRVARAIAKCQVLGEV